MLARPGRDAPPNMTDYLAERGRPDILTVPECFNYVADVLDAQAEVRPTELALLSLGPRGELVLEQSFTEVSRAAIHMANVFTGMGVKKGDRIFVMLPRVPEWYQVVLGAIRLGAIPMPATTQLTPRDWTRWRTNYPRYATASWWEMLPAPNGRSCQGFSRGPRPAQFQPPCAPAPIPCFSTSRVAP